MNDKGEYSIVISGAYHGTVRLTLIDGNDSGHDYWDEASGSKDIGELHAIGYLKGGQINIIMLTPLTNVAANKLAGLNPTESEINAVNKAVAELFGLEDIINTAPIPVVTQTGANNLKNANAYGKALAVLSEVEKQLGDSGNPEPAKTAADILGNVLPGSTTPPTSSQNAAARSLLLDGVQGAVNNGLLDNTDKQALETHVITVLAPPTPSVALTHDTGIAGDKITHIGDLTVTGIISGNRWEYSTDGNTWKTGSGNSIPASALGSDGAKSVQVRQSDAEGHSSPNSPSYSFTLDTSKPAAPVVTLTVDSGSSNSDKITNNAALTVSGIEAGNSWEYSIDGSSWKAGSGNSIPASALGSDGVKSVQLRQTDIAGNISDASTAYTFKARSESSIARIYLRLWGL